MATLPSSCCADDVARGLSRLFHRQSLTVLCEVPLPNGRRADMVAIDAKGQISIIEIKVGKGELMGDSKWPHYLDWCDRFYWALSPALDPDWIAGPDWQPERCGLIVADRYDALVMREAASTTLPTARRRSELLRTGRRAMRRMMLSLDPELIAHAGEQDIGM